MTYHVVKEQRRRIYYVPQRSLAMKTLPLSKAIDGFLLSCRARRLSIHTLTDYERTLRKFLKHVGDAPIQNISTTQISAFLANQEWSAKTVLNYHIGLSALWTWAIKEGYTDKHIMRLV